MNRWSSTETQLRPLSKSCNHALVLVACRFHVKIVFTVANRCCRVDKMMIHRHARIFYYHVSQLSESTQPTVAVRRGLTPNAKPKAMRKTPTREALTLPYLMKRHPRSLLLVLGSGSLLPSPSTH